MLNWVVYGAVNGDNTRSYDVGESCRCLFITRVFIDQGQQGNL